MALAFPILLVLQVLVLSPTYTVEGACDPKDKAVLLSLQASFKSGSPWDPSVNATIDCCSWPGITCSSSGRVISLELSLAVPHTEEKSDFPRIICQLDALEKLVLNQSLLFTGVIPRCIGNNLKELRHLDLSDNDFVGKIPAELGFLSKLEYLHLGNNNLGGGIPTELCKLKNLTDFSLERLRFPKSAHSQGSIPECITGLSRLRFLNLIFNSFTGTLPHTLADLANLEELLLYGNDFTGSIPSSIGRLSRLRKLNMNSPKTAGSLPSSFNNLAALEELELNDMSLSGPLPDFTSFKDIKVVRLINCSFSGTLPAKFAKGKLEKLGYLDLQMNALSGEIPASFPTGIPNVETMLLSFNLLTGAIPSTFASLGRLTLFDINNNKLSGPIPDSLGDMNSTVMLDMSYNQLTGTFPVSLCKLRRLWFSNNKLTSLNSGARTTATTRLQSLDVSFNEITGPIPGWLTKQNGLYSLDLSHNRLTGSIPTGLAKFGLSDVNFSYNHLSGPIPKGFSDFRADAFENNPGLCGAPLAPCNKTRVHLSNALYK